MCEKGGLRLEDTKAVFPKLILLHMFKPLLGYRYIVIGQESAEVPPSCILPEATLGLIKI